MEVIVGEPGLVSLVGFSGGFTEIPESQPSWVTVTDRPCVSSKWSGTWIEGAPCFPSGLPCS